MNTEPTTQLTGDPAVVLKRLVRPRPGQVWAFGGADGRRDTIKRVSRGMVGAWRLDNGRLIPLARATAMWVQWESRMATITVTHLWENWVCIGPNAAPEPRGE